jgi:hypothetical protein
LQIPDQSTATRRGRFHFRETSLHDAETPLFSTVNFHDAETPLFSTDDLHTAETPLVNPLDLLLSRITTILHFLLFSVAGTPLSAIRPSSPLPKHQTHTFFPPPQPDYLFHFLIILHWRNNSVQQSFRLSPSMLQHHCSALLTFSPMLKHHYSTLFLPTPRTLQSIIFSPSIIDETIPSSNCFAFFRC